MGFIVSDKDKAQLLLVNEKGSQFGKVMELLPTIIEKVADNIKGVKVSGSPAPAKGKGKE